MEVLVGLLIAAGLMVLAVWLYITKQGDAEFEFMVEQASEFEVVECTDTAVVVSCSVPFVNKGSQDGTIMDCYTRHLLPYEQYDGVAVYSRLELDQARRTDGYFEAVIIPKQTGGTVIVTIRLEARRGTIAQALVPMVDMPVDLVYQVVARSDWYITKTRLVITAQAVKTAAGRLMAMEE